MSYLSDSCSLNRTNMFFQCVWLCQLGKDFQIKCEYFSQVLTQTLAWKQKQEREIDTKNLKQNRTERENERKKERKKVETRKRVWQSRDQCGLVHKWMTCISVYTKS